MSTRLKLLTALTAAAAMLAATAASATASNPASNNCFRTRDFQAWKSPSPNVVLVKVGASRIFRLDLREGSDQLKYSDVRLINRNIQTSWLCGPLDFNLILTDRSGVLHEPLIVASVRQLTPDEIAAIPQKDLP